MMALIFMNHVIFVGSNYAVSQKNTLEYVALSKESLLSLSSNFGTLTMIYDLSNLKLNK